MNRLDTELQRLYGVPSPSVGQADTLTLCGTDGRVRAMAIELRQPAWPAAAALWSGVQDDLEWPAPALAVNGADGYQLWFSLREPVPAEVAYQCLESLRRRYLGDVPAARVGVFPPASGDQAPGATPWALPPRPNGDERWSAFVAPGLAPMFADEHWLDLEPSADAQADLLQRLDSIGPAELERARERLGASGSATGATPERPASLSAAATPPSALTVGQSPATATAGPRQFLLAVMNDPSVDMALRIDAAKALLPYL